MLLNRRLFMIGLIGSLLGGIGGLIGAGTGIANSVIQNQQADNNMSMSQEQFKWNKNFQERNWQYQQELNMLNRQDSLNLINQTMAREDNSIQRRAADLEAAGFSRHLAAGTGASASSFSMPSHSAAGGASIPAPQRALTQLQLSNTVINDMVGVLEGVERVARSKEERLLLNDQRNLILAQIADTQANTGYTGTKREREEIARDFEKNYNKPLPMLQSSVSANIGQTGLSFSGPYAALDNLEKVVDKYVSQGKKLVEDLSPKEVLDNIGGKLRSGLTWLSDQFRK